MNDIRKSAQPISRARRSVLAALGGLGAAALLRGPAAVAAEALETTTVRLVNDTVICEAPLFAAAELLRADGFTDIRYIDVSPDDAKAVGDALSQGKVDFGLDFVLFAIPGLERGAQTALAGVHTGCFELFARNDIRGITGLKGKVVGLQASPPDLLNLMARQVGLDPAKDIRWVTGADPKINPLELFATGEIDAFLGFPPEPQELRAKKIGHVLVNTAQDKPWSQYLCCLLAGNREFVSRNPVATKRVLRAMLKSTDLCATEPARAAQALVDRGLAQRYDYALQTLTDNGYDRWRDYDPEDTVRFYALRLHEVGLIQSSPQKIIAEGTDWRFFNELKRELKA
jgi:NitT/TauT family transport system substrate-binding protein